MKLLRILTGHHAGAQVLLEPGAYRIGTDDDADIQLTDWQGADILLIVEPNGAVRSQRHEARAEVELAATEVQPEAEATTETPNPTLDPGEVWMIDFVPMQFDDTALCVGAADAQWPSDLALLSTLLTAPAQAQREADNTERAKRRRYIGIAAAFIGISAGVAGVSFALTTNVSRAAMSPADLRLEQRANRELADAHLSELHVTRDGTAGNGGPPRAVATGMVRSASEDYIARQVFERMKPGVIAHRYRVADDTARGIRDAIGMDGVQVGYDGQGVFTVSGAVTDRQRVENALNRVRGDFDKSIMQIRVKLTDISQPASAPQQGTFTSLVSSGDVQYAETPDGVKHIYASQTEPEPQTETQVDSAMITTAGRPAADAHPVRADPMPLPSDDNPAAH
ncbi:secretion protein [Caballeronia mineralivorans]|uniref:secretion protein n=1 Tax=Caballeronia mineralivorans TaxID=2010198 RepID=UPI0023F05A25|nr:secretion protein [Caballeronia mineralivorans]MDB5787015.1 hypothetical protein [Caballeronia mineralivorans]MEA3098918.1 type secretion protein [Caballeronia mineralivorans]